MRTEPLRAMVIGAFVRGLSMRASSRCASKAGLGKLSKSTASRICQELRERFEAFGRRDLYDIRLAALFLDAVFLSVRPDGPNGLAGGTGGDRFAVRGLGLVLAAGLPGQQVAEACSRRR